MAGPTLAIVEPKAWLSRTSLFMRQRGGTLLEVDRAYEKYYRTRSEENGQVLYFFLHKYLLEKGGNWEKVNRDKASDGLMRHVYNSLAPKRGRNVLEKRAPEARHGVLYLWQNAKIETQWLKISLEGALSVGGNAISTFQASSYQSGDKLQSLGKIGQNSPLNHLSTGFDIGQKVDQAANVAGYGPTGKVKQVKLPEERHDGAIAASEIREDPSVYDKAKAVLGAASFAKVWTLIKEAVHKAWESTKMKWYSGQIWGSIGAATAAVANFILGKVVAYAAPFASNAISIAQGLVQAFRAGVDRVSAWHQRGKFVVVPGHPSAIANAIQSQMNWDIASGLYNVAKGGVLLTGEAFSAGASALVNLVAACLEFVYKLFTRIHQAYSMSGWIKQVRASVGGAWQEDADDERRTRRPAIAFNEDAFKQLFEEGCNASVCVPMLTLNSGIAGDLMMFMKMFDDSGGILGQSQAGGWSGPSEGAQRAFDAGESYWTAMKQKSRDYLASTGFVFSSTDPYAQRLMAHALKNHVGIASTFDRALAFGAAS